MSRRVLGDSDVYQGQPACALRSHESHYLPGLDMLMKDVNANVNGALY